MEYTIQGGLSNEYTVFFYNCKKGSKVNFKLDIELYNIYKGKKNYLSGATKPPSSQPAAAATVAAATQESTRLVDLPQLTPLPCVPRNSG